MTDIGKKYKLLLVDDEEAWSNDLKGELERLNFEVVYEKDAENTLKRIREVKPDAVLLDILFNQENKGKPTFDEIQCKYSAVPVILLTSTVKDTYNDDDFPGRAFPYPKESLKPEDEKTYYSFAKKIREAIEGVNDISKHIDKFGFIVGMTDEMWSVCRTILKTAKSDSYVLITGEEGTGKELIAKTIHNLSGRKGRFVDVHCGAITDTLVESELFGVCAEAATGVSETEGLFEQADKGTIFLDEIGTMPLSHQAKLLKVLQNKKISRVKSSPNCECENKKHPDHTAIKVDVRVIAATNIDISKAITENKFRKDLFDRLNVIRIHMPPLRQRKEDIGILYKHFIKELNIELGEKLSKKYEDVLRPDVKEMLEKYDWPGNIRELGKAIESAMNISDSTILLKKDFPAEVRGSNKKRDELLCDPEVAVERCVKGEIGYHEIAKAIAPIKSPAMVAILEGICRRYYDENGDLTEDLLIPVLKFRTRANVQRVLSDHGISTKELKQQYKEKKLNKKT